MRNMLLLVTVGLFSYTSQAQNPYLGELKYTSTGFTVFKIDASCYGSGLKPYVNGQELTNYSIIYCWDGICIYRFPFGTLRVGDVVTVRDNCGRTSAPVIVKDDYVYVEVSNGTSYTGNGITPTDEREPYSMLTNPIQVGKCEQVKNINSHALHTLRVQLGTNDNNTYTSGVMKLNGVLLKSSDILLDRQGSTSSTVTVNSNGSLTYKGRSSISTVQNFSGRTVFSFEYQHNGVLPFDLQQITIGPLSFRMWSNSRITVYESKWDGSVVEQEIYQDISNASFKITFNTGEFKLFINNVEVKNIPRTVIYSASSGSISDGSLLPYASPVNWTPGNSGSQWVQAIIDGVRVVRQQFSVAEDMVISESTVNVACNGGNSGSITVNLTGGKSAFQYSKDGGSTYQTGNTFTGLTAGNYAIKVKDASGCFAQKTVTLTQNSELTVSSTKNDISCTGGNDGSVTLSGSGGAGFYQYKLDGGTYSSNATIGGLTAGTKTFWVMDAAGCEKSTNVTLNTRSTFDFTVSPTPVACNGNATGSLSITPSGTAVGTIQYSINNVNFQTGTTFSNLAAGTYTIYAKDDLCSISRGGNTISQPTLLVPNVSVSQVVSCNGGNDGKLSANPTGGVSNYTFSTDGSTYTSPSAATHTFSNLPAGNYKVWVKDANGCIKDEIVTINQPDVWTVSVNSKTDASCFGYTNGEVALTVTGGNGLSSFKIGTKSYAASSITALAAGNYTITAIDTKNCQASTTVEILQPNKLTISPTITQQVSCNGGNNGEINVTAAGGTTPYTYSVGGTFQPSGNFTGLLKNTYTVSVKDAKGCQTDSTNNTITEPSAIALGTTITDVLCYGGNDGKVQVTATGGVGNYTYSKDGTNFTTNNLFTDFIIGTYTFTVKDGNACLKTIQAIVGQPTDLTVSLAKTQDVLCFGGKSGKLTTTTSGGTSPYRYSFDGINFTNGTSASSHLIDTLQIGTYQVIVKDAHGCQKTTGQVTLTQPTDIQFSISSQQQVSCFGGNDGRVVLAATGGTPAYQFKQNAGSFVNSPTFSGLPQGTYSYEVKDAHGCTKSLSTTITQPAAAYTISLTQAISLSCFENRSGSIQIANVGGTSPYRTWISPSNPTDTLTTTQATFTGLEARSYEIKGKDAKNCPFTLPIVTLTQPTDINIQLLQKTDVDCDVYARGSAKLSASGSHGGFSYTLSGNDFQNNPIVSIQTTDGVFDRLKAGNYVLTATDQLGCAKNHTVTITAKSSTIRFDVNKTLPSSCLSSDGSISIQNLSGGRNPYYYSLSTQPSVTANPQFTNLSNGTYIVTVSDSLCFTHKDVDLRLPTSINTSYTIQPISCTTPDATLTFTNITGGNGNYEISKDGSSFTTSRTFTSLAPKVYAFTIQDNPLSCRTIQSIEIKEQNRAGLEFVERTNILCYGFATGVIEVKGTNNLAPFQYAINSLNFGSSGRFTGLAAGNYRLYARNSIGCMDSLKATLTQPTLLVNTTTKNDNLCFGDNSGNLTVQASGGVSPYQFSIDNVNYGSGNSFTNLTAGNYTTYLKDAHGCITPQGVALIQPSNVVVTPIYADTIRCWGEQNGKVTIQATGGTPGYQYSMDNSSYFAPNFFGNLGTGTYTFYVKDAHQCVRQASLTLTQPDSLKLSFVNKTHPLCYQSSDGTIQVSSVGGNSGNYYTLNSSRTQPTTQFVNLPQGTYTIDVTDRKGCTDRVNNIVLTHPTQLVHSISTVEPLCKGDKNGSVSINVTGGTQAYLLNIDGVDYSPMQGQNTFLFGKQGARTYNFTTKDANRCEDKFTVILGEPTRLIAQASVTPNLCFGDSTGILHLFGQGATPPYRYSILNGYRMSDTTFTKTNYYDKLLSKTYLIRVKDAHECQYDSLVNVPQPTQVSFSSFLADSVRCFGEVNGKIAIKAQGGTPGYVYSLDNKNYQEADTIKSLKAGYYQLNVKDSHQCLAKQDSFEVKQPALLQASVAAKTNPLCAGEQNGTIKLKAVGGNSQYSYLMDNRLQQKEALFENLNQGNYTFKITDWKGCEDTVTFVSLKWPQALAAKLSQQLPTCYGDANAALTLAIDGGVGSYKAQLFPGSIDLILANNFTNNSLLPTANYRFENLKAGEYLAKVTDVNGCQLLIPTTIQEAQKLNEVIFPDPVPVCKNQVVKLQSNNLGQDINWYFAGNQIKENNAPVKSENLDAVAPGLYKVEIRNATGCLKEATYELQNSNKALLADFLMTIQAFEGDTVYALDISKPAPDEIIWTLPAEANILEETNRDMTFQLYDTGTYTIEMLAKSGDCINTKTRTIEIFKKGEVEKTDSELFYATYNIIQSANVFPNPNYGKFTLDVNLTKTEDITVSIVRSSTRVQLFKENYTGKSSYSIPIDLKNFYQDTYLLTVQAGNSTLVKRLLLMN